MANRSACLVTLGSLALLAAACNGSSTSEWCASNAAQAVTSCPSGTTLKGVDVSHYDGTIDWATAHGTGGIDFAFAKATEGTSFTDPTFATNWAGMKSAGVVRGAYHFFHANIDPTAQMTYFVAEITKAGGLQPGDLPPAIDFEVTDSVAPATIAANLKTAIDALQKATGMKPIVYTSPGFANGILPAGFGSSSTLWVANWQVSCPNLPTAWTGWSFWQSADNGTVAGITGTSAVDLDQFDGTLAQLQSFGGAPSTGDAGSGATPGDAGAAAGDGGSAAGQDSGASPGIGSDGGSGTPSAGGGVLEGGAGSSAGQSNPCGGA